MTSYRDHFQSYRHNVSEKARQYASGLMQAGPRKNMDRMAEVVPGTKSRSLQQFITHSKWNARDVIDHVARDANSLLGDPQQACLTIDESCFEKQGKMSIGVSRQWLGRFGKVDNGQVGVFASLTNGRYTVPVDERFYLPEEWTNDKERCDKAGIPEALQEFKTKPQLALEIVEHAIELGLQFGWVGADAGYGKGPGFCRALDNMGQTFVVDIHSDFNVYLEDPKPYLPKKTSKRGPKIKKLRTDIDSVEAKNIVSKSVLDSQPIIKLRNTTRGSLRVRAYSQPVYIWDGKTAIVDKWYFVITKTLGRNGDTKISLTNADPATELKTLAWMQRQRYWVERAFEDAKSECGMADYQVRKWNAWHHHMALVMMAMLFMLTERVSHEDTYPLLSCADIEDLL